MITASGSVDEYWEQPSTLIPGHADRLSWWLLPAQLATMIRPDIGLVVAGDAEIVSNRGARTAAPIVAAILGVFAAVGVEWIYTESLLVMLPLMAIALAVPSLGVLTFGVYLVTDLIWFFVDPPGGYDRSILGVAGQLLGAYLLWLLAVEIPVVFRRLQRSALLGSYRGSLREMAKLALSIVVVGTLTFLWVETTPLLMRPLFFWAGRRDPTVEAVATIQTNVAWIVAWAMACGVAALVLYMRRSSVSPIALPGSVGGRLLPGRILLGVNIAVFVALFGGLITSPFDVVLILGAFLVAEAASRFLPRFPGYGRLIASAPDFVRAIAGLAAASLAGRIVAGSQWRSVAGSEFFPITVAFAFGYIILRILLPRGGVATVVAVDYVEPVPRDRSWVVGAVQILVLIGVMLLALQTPVRADNCSGRSDCFGNARGRAVAAAVGAALVGASVSSGREQRRRVFFVRDSKVYVMQQPRRFTAKLGDLQYMDPVEIIGDLKDGWYKVNYNGQVGYLPHQAVTRGESPNSVARDRQYKPRRGRAVQLGTRG